MSLYSIRKNRKTAFSLAEMLVVMLILSIVVLSMIPLAAKRVKRETINPEHGAFECYYDDQGKLHQITRDAKGNIVKKDDNVAGGSCIFSPKKGAMFFVVNAVGGGSPGTGVTAAFNQLQRGERASGGTGFYGANYTSVYNKFMSKYIESDNGKTVDFSGVVDSEPGGSGPKQWLQDSYVTLKAILTTEAGKQEFYTRDMSRKVSGGFIKLEKYPENPDCEGPIPNFGDRVSDPTGGNKITNCFADWRYHGNSPERGARVMFVLKAIQNGVFEELNQHPTELDSVMLNGSLQSGNPLQGIGFGIRDPKATNNQSVGCFIPNGADGCYYSGNSSFEDAQYVANCRYSNYLKQHDKIYNLADDIKCPTSSSLRQYLSGYGYIPAVTTLESSLPDAYGYGSYDTRCYYSKLCDEDVRGVGCTYRPCQFNLNYSYYTKLPRVILGNFVLIFQEMRKGLNFYAQAGNPGEYKTIYIAKLDGKLKITPGAPQTFNKSQSIYTENKAGNDTVIEYADKVADFVLVAKGGKPAYNSNYNTFILGNIFDPLPTGGGVIAHNTSNGDNSGLDSEYGGYFKPKNSEFVYPIPDSDEMIPEYVGRGGMGSHTVFRLNAKPNVFKMFRAYDSDKSSSGSTPTETTSSYTCGDGSVISGSNNAENYRCYGTTGYGGAVVITW